MASPTRRRGFLATFAAATAAAGVLLTAAPSVADGYPDKPVTLIVPYKAGGSTETLAQVFSKALSAELGQPVVVKTRPGGGGAVGSTEVAAMEPDGYTILMVGTDSLLWTPLTQDVEYGLDSFTYIAQISEYQQAIVAKEDAPFSTFDELIAYSKEHPGLNFADQGAMSQAFIAYVAEKEGLDWTGIPTKGGGEMVPFLLGGKVDFAWSGGVHGRYAGKIKVLASTNAERLAASPEAVSLNEKYGIAMPSHLVLVGPKGLPDEVVATVAKAAEAAMDEPDFHTLLTEKLLFPSKFVGAEALKADIDATIPSLKAIAEKSQ